MTEPQYAQGDDVGAVFTARHTYGKDASGDHLVRVVSPVGVFSEFIGTPGAELVILTPNDQAYVQPQGKLRLQAHIKYSDPDMEPRQVTAQAEWESSNRNVATVGTNTGTTKGALTGRNKGTTTITARYGGLKARRKIQVREAAPRSLSIESATGNTTVQAGQKLPLRSTVTYQDGKTQAVTGKTKWSTSDKQVATVSNSGEVAGVKAGKATITGQYQPQEGKPLATELEVTVKATLNSGESTEDGGQDSKPEKPETPETPEKPETPETPDEGSGSDGDSTFPPEGGVQDPSQGGGATDPSQGGGAQDPSQGGQPAEGGVQPQYQQ